MAQYKDIFKIRHNNISPEKGKILISEPFMQDVYFQRSVILLVEHNEKGSMGFVMNKNTGLWVNDFMEELDDMPILPLYLGGPVSSDHLFFVHTLGNVIPNSIQINEHLFFDGDFESLRCYILGGNPIKGLVRFFLGYSGWTKSQLSKEINEDSWLVGRPVDKNILLSEGESCWKQAVETIGGSYKTWINYPKNPLLN